MAFIEIVGFDVSDERRSLISQRITEELTRILDVSSDTISIYYFSVKPAHYAHAGSVSSTVRQRIFIKVHLLARSGSILRAAAKSIAEVVATELQHDPRDIAVYFLIRQPEEVAHGGILESDRRSALQ
jgi:phenylpyruvate tautomerase PptA (4-oxalocrotonate tautomerase family)